MASDIQPSTTNTAQIILIGGGVGVLPTTALAWPVLQPASESSLSGLERLFQTHGFWGK